MPPFDPTQARQDVLTRQLQGRPALLATAVVTLAAGGETPVTHAHGLPRVPVVVGAYLRDTSLTGAGHWCTFAFRSADATSTVWAVRNPSAITVNVVIEYAVR